MYTAKKLHLFTREIAFTHFTSFCVPSDYPGSSGFAKLFLNFIIKFIKYNCFNAKGNI